MVKKILATTLAAAGLAAAAVPASAQEFKIGFLMTMNHPLGKQSVNGFRLGLKSEGWEKNGDKLGGAPTNVYWADDQFKPDVARQEVDKFIKSEKVDVISGIIWSNILMAVQRPAVRSKTILLITNAGAGPMFGRLCTRISSPPRGTTTRNPRRRVA